MADDRSDSQDVSRDEEDDMSQPVEQSQTEDVEPLRGMVSQPIDNDGERDDGSRQGPTDDASRQSLAEEANVMPVPIDASQGTVPGGSQVDENEIMIQPSLPIAASQYHYNDDEASEEQADDDDTSRPFVEPSLPVDASQLTDDISRPGIIGSAQSDQDEASPPRRRVFNAAASVADEQSRASIPDNESSRYTHDDASRTSVPELRRPRFAEKDDISDTGSPSRRMATSLSGAVIWGTQVDANVVRQQFRQFLHAFEADEYGEGHYLRVLDSIAVSKEYSLNINCGDHLHSFDNGHLYKLLVRYPTEMIPLMDVVVHEEYVERHPEDNLDSAGIRIQVRVYNLRDKKKMRELNPENIDQLVAIEGMIVRCSPIVPDMKLGLFKCHQCNFEVEVPLERNRIAEPKKCAHCASVLSFRLVHNRCLFADKQTVKIQETPENVTEGETPHTCTVLAHDSLVDVCKPGDRVTLTGIYRASAVRVDPRRRTVHAVYKTHLDVLHVRRKQQGKLRDAMPVEDAGTREVHRSFQETDQVMNENQQVIDEMKFREMAASSTLYEDMSRSLAPSIYELMDVKKGLLLQMMGSTNSISAEASVDTLVGQRAARTRGEINILLCGDPGTSKSQLLSYVHRVAPRGIYTSGKGSSAVGLTAYITKDPDTKELVLESGALVLSDRGVCCIDEFDKMNDATRAILHEVMEQQTISLAKAGIICTLNARTSILASANPVGSRYDPRKSVVENLQLPPTLLTRFDLIYLILDKSDADSDRKLARHLVQLYRARPEKQDLSEERLYDLETLSKYIAYAKENCRPQLSDRAKRKLVDAYIEMRRLGTLGGGGKKTIVATPRQLESFVRLAEAKAKLRLAAEVTGEDVDEAIRLFNVATHRAAMDPRTGTIDMDAINTGKSSLQRLAEQSLQEFIRSVIQEQYQRGDVVNRRSLLDSLNSRANVSKIELSELDRAFDALSREQVVVMGAGGAIRVC